MPRHPKPWFRKGRGWYVQRDGKQVFLAASKSDAFAAYHEEMRRPKTNVSVRTDLLVSLVDAFLEWVKTNWSEATYRWYLDRLQQFCRLHPDLRISELKPLHVQKWIDPQQVSNGTKRNCVRSIMRCMRWAEEQGYIEKSPIAHFKKPRGGVRQTVICPDEYQRILQAVRSPEFRDLIVFAWESGARAMECLALERRHLDLPNARIIFPIDEEKMERAPRVIYLTAEAAEIVSRLSRQHATGRIFRNTDGKPWTTEAVNCTFVNLQVRMGKAVLKSENYELPDGSIADKINSLKPNRFTNGRSIAKSPADLREEAMKKLWIAAAVMRAPKYCLTAFRHSFCHRLLKAGVDALTVSNLMGHAGVSMVVEFYSHMNHAPTYLKDSLEKGRF